MRRDEVLSSIARLNAAKKISIESNEIASRPSTSGMVGQAGGVLRIRDRATIQEQTKPAAEKPKTERQKLSDFYYGEHLKETAAKEAEQTEKERKRRERQAAEDRARWQREQDEATLKAAQERRHKQIADSLIRSEIKGIMQDHYDITEEVVALVKSWGESMMKFPPAWSQAVEIVRARGDKR